MELTEKIDSVENISIENFNQNYFNPQKPVIIKGLAKEKEAGNYWSIDYFKKKMGDVIVDIYDNKNKENRKSAFTTPDLKMKFADYLDILSKDEPSDLRIFLFDLFKHNPNLQKEFPCPNLFKGVLDNIGHMFFGGKDATVRIHYDIDMSNVLLTHFVGKKRVVLISPEYSDILYRLPLNTYSLINPDQPDYEKHPALKYVKGYDFILNPGDSLFMPSGYWHYMTYLEVGFSVSYRRIGPTLSNPIKGLINLGIYMPLDKLLNKTLNDKWFFTKEHLATRRTNKNILNKETELAEVAF